MSRNWDLTLGRRYLDTMLKREVAPSPPAPAPAPFTTFPEAPRIALPLAPVAAAAPHDPAPLGTPQLAAFLRNGNGLVGRKLDVNWNHATRQLASLARPAYNRPAASGGGLSPATCYVVASSACDVPRGVHYYNPALHALEQLDPRDRLRELADLLGDGDAADLYVVLCANVWRNAFKYQEFSFYLLSQDLGVAAGALMLAAEPLGWRIAWHRWFSDASVAALVAPAPGEAVFSVLGIHRRPPRAATLRPPRHDPPPPPAALSDRLPAVVRELFAACEVAGERARPVPSPPPREPPDATRVIVPLPWHELRVDAVALARRTTTWGGYRARPAAALEPLGTALRFATQSRALADADAAEHHRLVRFVLHVNHVAGVAAGVYELDEDRLRLERLAGPVPNLQQLTLHQNNNLEQAAVVIGIVGRTEAAMAAWGNRGLRILGGEIGRRVQNLYVAAAALGWGASAICGFASRPANEAFVVRDPDETVLHLFLLGPQRERVEAFRYFL